MSTVVKQAKDRHYGAVIKEVGRGVHGARALSTLDAESLFGAMLDGEVPDLELGAILLAYRIKGETVEELLGFARALRQRTVWIDAPPGLLPVVLPSYNGARKLPNLTALVALLLTRRGVPVLIHGLSDGYGRVTTEKILAEMGVSRCASAAEAAGRLRSDRIAYVPTEVLCPGLAGLLNARLRLGVRGSAHTMAKLLDPFAGRCVRVVPLTHPEYFDTMRPCLVSAGSPALLMRGSEGEPYAGPTRPLRVEIITGESSRTVEEPRPADDVALPAGIDAVSTARWIEAALAGSAPIPAPILRLAGWCADAAAGG